MLAFSRIRILLVSLTSLTVSGLGLGLAPSIFAQQGVRQEVEHLYGKYVRSGYDSDDWSRLRTVALGKKNHRNVRARAIEYLIRIDLSRVQGDLTVVASDASEPRFLRSLALVGLWRARLARASDPKAALRDALNVELNGKPVRALVDWIADEVAFRGLREFADLVASELRVVHGDDDSSQKIVDSFLLRTVTMSRSTDNPTRGLVELLNQDDSTDRWQNRRWAVRRLADADSNISVPALVAAALDLEGKYYRDLPDGSRKLRSTDPEFMTEFSNATYLYHAIRESLRLLGASEARLAELGYHSDWRMFATIR